MADNEKKIGVPIDDDALDGVVGGMGSRDLTNGRGSIGTMESLNSDAENTAEEFRQGINLGNMLGRY